MPKTALFALLLVACGAAPGPDNVTVEPEPGEAGAPAAEPEPRAGGPGSLAGAPSVAGNSGSGGTAAGAMAGQPGAGAPTVGGSGGSAGSGPSPGGAGGSAGLPGAGAGGMAGAAPAPNACEPPSQDGPLSGARDCTADCADGTVPCEGSCGQMPAGGCTGSFMSNVAGADFSFVVDAGQAWTFNAAPGVCVRVTAMAGTFPQLGGKTQACASLCAEEVSGITAKLKNRGWLRVESASQALGCSP